MDPSITQPWLDALYWMHQHCLSTRSLWQPLRPGFVIERSEFYHANTPASHVNKLQFLYNPSLEHAEISLYHLMGANVLTKPADIFIETANLKLAVMEANMHETDEMLLKLINALPTACAPQTSIDGRRYVLKGRSSVTYSFHLDRSRDGDVACATTSLTDADNFYVELTPHPRTVIKCTDGSTTERPPTMEDLLVFNPIFSKLEQWALHALRR